MHIKYYEIEGTRLAVTEIHSVQIFEDYNDGGFFLVPNRNMRESDVLDATVSRLAALCCGLPTVLARSKEIHSRAMDDQDKDIDNFLHVSCQTSRPNPYEDCIAWYETLEEANTAVARIAAAIARGDRLFDLTE